jgi:hypothetical protein
MNTIKFKSKVPKEKWNHVLRIVVIANKVSMENLNRTAVRLALGPWSFVIANFVSIEKQETNWYHGALCERDGLT